MVGWYSLFRGKIAIHLCLLKVIATHEPYLTCVAVDLELLFQHPARSACIFCFSESDFGSAILRCANKSRELKNGARPLLRGPLLYPLTNHFHLYPRRS